MAYKEFDFFVEKTGLPEQAKKVDPDRLSAMAAFLPQSLIDYWSQYGIGLIQKGRFQFCDPGDLEEILEFVFSDDGLLKPLAMHVFGYSAFGVLYVWSEAFTTIFVDLLTGEVYGGGLTSDTILATSKKLGFSKAIFVDLSMIKGKTYEGMDDKGKPLLARAEKRLGPLSPGECYGFVPALPLGGSAQLDNLRKLRALEHFALLSQAQTFRLTDYQTGVRKVIRDIGG